MSSITIIPELDAGGTVTSVTGTANRITSTGGTTPQIDIASTYVGQTSITTLGTITTGTWNGTVIDVAHGGTGVATTTAFGVLLGGTTATGPFQNAGEGTLGQVLTSNGPGVAPSFQDAPLTGTGTTVGAVTSNVITFPLGGVAGTFQFEARVKAYEATGPAGAGYNVYATFTTDGATATLVGDQDVFNEDASLSTADAYFIASANNAILQVLGVAALTINWSAEAAVT
jgi:hypothetical protein